MNVSSSIYHLNSNFLERRSDNIINSKLKLTPTVHSRAHDRECAIYRKAIDTLDKTLAEIISECQDITKFTGMKMNLNPMKDTNNTDDTDDNATNRTSNLQEESLDLLAVATKDRDVAQKELNVIKDRLERVSNVLHYLGMYISYNNIYYYY